jgi:hypothetical protein
MFGDRVDKRIAGARVLEEERANTNRDGTEEA